MPRSGRKWADRARFMPLGLLLVAILLFVQSGRPVRSTNENAAMRAAAGRSLSDEYYDAAADDDDDDLDRAGLAVLVCIVLCLIAVTLAFEKFKTSLEENCSEDTQLILEKLFGE